MKQAGDKGSTARPGDERRTLAAAAARALQRAWWLVAVRGALAILVGVFMLTRPGMAMSVLFATLGTYLFLDGVLALATAFHAARGERSWWPYVLEGMLSVAVGILAFVHPAAMKLALLSLIAARSLITGAVEIATGVSLKRARGERPWMLWLGGLASLALGVFLLVRPASAAVLLVWLAGMYAIVFGITLVATALRLRRAAVGLRAHSPT